MPLDCYVVVRIWLIQMQHDKHILFSTGKALAYSLRSTYSEEINLSHLFPCFLSTWQPHGQPEISHQ